MVKLNIRFGELETRLLFKLEEKEASVITVSQIANTLGISKNHANKLAWQLARKKRLLRLRKGVYLFAPLKAGPKGLWSEHAFAILPDLMAGKDYYVSFWTALNHYGLTEQIPLVTQVVVTRTMRSFEAVQTRFRFIKLRRLGEWREEKISGKNVRIATIEQLLLDCASHPGYCGGMSEVCKALWEARKKTDWKKLEELLLASNDATRRRLGFLLELLELKRLAPGKTFSGWRWLDPTAVKALKGKSKKWGLLLNLTGNELTSWQEN